MSQKRDTGEPFYQRMKEEHGTRCRICGASPVVYHHLIPLSDGGTNESGNIIALCTRCHKLVHGCRDRKGYTDKYGGGRPQKRVKDWEKILLQWANSEIGTAEAKRKLCLSPNTHLTDIKWVKEYLQSCGIKKVHNTVDVKTSKQLYYERNRQVGHFCL